MVVALCKDAVVVEANPEIPRLASFWLLLARFLHGKLIMQVGGQSITCQPRIQKNALQNQMKYVRLSMEIKSRPHHLISSGHVIGSFRPHTR